MRTTDKKYGIKREGWLSGLSGAAAFFFLTSVLPLAFPVPLRSQSLPLDDKARYERSLELKADEVILKLLGPSQAKVVVQASMDFTRTEKVEVVSSKAVSADKAKMFKWESMAAEGENFSEYLLPGFPALEEESAPSQSYQKQMLFPASFIKKLTVTVIINKDMAESEVQAVRNVVSEVLGLDSARGDALAIIKAPFAPFWRTIWYTPDALNLVFKYGVLTLMGIVSMIVVSVGFLKLAGAMNTMAKAQQSHQITMDLGKGAAGGGGLPGSFTPGGETLELAGPGRKESPGGEEAGGQELVFNIRPDQVDFLVDLMSGEDPSNVALVAGHMEGGVRSEFLRKLPPDFSSEVISSMATVRFVEADVMMTIKEELERRLAGAFGGVSKVLESLNRVNLRTKKEMLEKLASRHPAIAKDVRAKIFLAEDLVKFSERDLSLLAAAVKPDDWACALWDLPPEFKDKLRNQFAEKAWQILEQTMKYGSPSKEKTDQAIETIVGAALALIKEGKVSSPSEAPAEPAAEAAAAPKGT